MHVLLARNFMVNTVWIMVNSRVMNHYM